jgi:hemoglobin/transferrin/lactoferrin receptor protein
MTRSQLRGSTAFLLLCLTAAPAVAQDAEDSGFLGTLTLTSGKRDINVDSPVSTTVVDEEEIKDRQPSTLADVVVSIPGVTLANGYSSHAAGVNIRGFGTDSIFGNDQSVVFLEDGASVGAEPIYRIATQAFTDPLLYKSIEVRRGTIGSFEYGMGITGGVVKSETKDASDFTGGEPGFKLGQTLEYASNGNARTSSTTLAWQPDEKLEVLGNYTIRKLDNYKGGDGETKLQTGGELPSALFKAKYTFGQDMEHALAYSYKQSTSDEKDVNFNALEPAGGFRRVNRTHEDRVHSLRYSYESATSDLLNLSVELTKSRRNTDNSLIPGVDYSFFGGFYDSDFEYTTTKLKVKNEASFATGSITHDLVAGFEVQNRDRDNTSTSTAVSGTDKRVAVFLIDDVQLTERFSITPALRWEQSKLDAKAGPRSVAVEETNSAWGGGLAAKYEFDNGFTVFGSGAYTEALPGIGNAGNDNEQSETYELGASYNGTDVLAAGDDLTVRGNVYKTKVWNLAGSVTDTESQGFELEASYGLQSGLYFDMNANIVDGTEYYGSDGLLGESSRIWRSTPADSIGFTVGKKWGETLDLSWEVAHNSESKRHVATRTTRVVEDVDAWTTHNLRATYKPQEGFLEGFEVRLGVENLLDEDYRPNLATYEAPGRNIKLTLSKVFF